MSDATRIAVGAGPAAYDVVVGSGLDARAGRRARGLGPARARRAPGGDGGAGQRVRDDAAAQHGFEAHVAEVPDGEAAKTAVVAAVLWRSSGRPASPAPTRSSRSAGERPPTWPASSRRPGCAACRSCTCRRRCWRWSTRRSAARPGSTPPRARTWSARSIRRGPCCATSTSLESLPRKDFVAGLAEVVKCGFIADPRILELVEADPAAASSWDAPVVRELIERSMQVKADVVTADLREAGAARDPQLRAHLRARRRARRGLPVAAR